MDISKLYQIFKDSQGVSTDTRTISSGQIYFALKGPSFNGNEYCSKAIDLGAGYCVIDDPEKNTSPQTILVDDVLSCLQDLAKYHRKKLKIPVIGLTGSNGKTTTKELIVAALKEKYRVAYTKGNLNNHIGVPLSLLSITDQDEIAVIEMGANAQKEIAFLSSITIPEIGLITNYGKAHLEGFGGVEGVIKGKSELYDNIRANGNTALVNLHDPIQMDKSKGCKQITYGKIEQADFIVEEHEVNDTYVSAKFSQQIIKSNLSGSYNFSNLSIAISLASYYGLKPEEIKKGIESYFPTNNRSQLDQGKHNQLLRDYYNANPSSMLAAIANFAGLDSAQRKKWVILGDMFELGEYEEMEHQHIADKASHQGFEKVILVGKAFQKTQSDAITFATTEELISYLTKEKPQNKSILIKGSRGMKLELAAELL